MSYGRANYCLQWGVGVEKNMMHAYARYPCVDIYISMKTLQRWDQKVDCLVCGNPPAKDNAQCDSATMTV